MRVVTPESVIQLQLHELVFISLELVHQRLYENKDGDGWFTEHIPVVSVNSIEQLFTKSEKNLAKIMPNKYIPTRSTIWCNGCHIYCDSQTRTRWWIRQIITKNNVSQIEHTHCESFKLDYKMPDSILNNNQRLQVYSVVIPRHQCNGQTIECRHCEFSKFWEIFYRYIVFLTGLYDAVTVESGVLFASNYSEDESPTHFFKSIMCKNTDRTYRLECYKTAYRYTPYLPELRSHLVSREELKVASGVLPFEFVSEKSIRERRTHLDFATHY